MKKVNMMSRKGLVVLLVLLAILGCMAGCDMQSSIQEVPATKEYSYINPDESKAEADAGFVIDGVFDEEAYGQSKWLYLNNTDGGNNVSIAMTSYYGQKGIYFAYDVTESVPIYVNLDRESYMNSCIEMYLVAPYVTSMQESDVFEIDLLPTGDMLFKRNNGKGGYIDVSSTNDIMACLGTTTKGGAVNTRDCYGYCMELFIPWDYLQWLQLDVQAIKDGYVYVNPAHITSYNHNGTDTGVDRLWYHYVQQTGASFSNVSRYFRFNGKGIMGSVPIELQSGANYTITGAKNVIPGMNAAVNIAPDEGYALKSVLVNGQEQIQNVDFNEDGSVTLKLLGTNDSAKISAKAEAVTDGVKTLSGKIVLNNVTADSMKDLVLSYIGPKGEKPLEVDANGCFELKDLEQGYYVIKAEKKGYQSVSRSIYLNQDFYTELTLEYDYFRVTQGSSWILDEQNNGILYKKEGAGQVLSNNTYYDFTFRANLKYDPDLAKQGTADEYTQQRTGMQVRFSNGKTWHIDLLKEKGKYILQYAKISGNNSLTNWQTIHTLDANQIARYTGQNGIRLSIMRQGNYAAIWLDNELIKIEILEEKYNSCSAQLGFESWAANKELLEVPFTVAKHSTVNVKASPFLAHATSWNVSGQYQGKVHKQGIEGNYTRLESALITDDVTTIAKDLSPETKDYSLAYHFKFSNGEQLRIRLHHTDSDGAYRIQTMDGTTVAPSWQVGYTLTEEQAAKIQAGGISYRVKLEGTTAYVYVDDTEACTYDISRVITTGKPSNIEKATAKVSFALDGNYGHTTELPFKLSDKSNDVMIVVEDMVGGTVTVNKESCKMGDTLQLTVAADPDYYYTGISVNGEQIDPNWDGTYRFKATENVYIITAEFASGWFRENPESSWNVLKQNQGVLKLESHKTGDSGWLSAAVDANDISVTVRDTSPAAKNFSMIYHFDFANGEALRLRLHHTDADGKYRVQVMDHSTVAEQWKDHYTLTEAQQKQITGDGLKFRVLIEDAQAKVYLEEQQVGTIDLSKVIATGNNSGVADAAIRVKLCMEGNLNKALELPFKLMDSGKRVTIHVDTFAGGKVTTADSNYQLGDTVILQVAPEAGYSQKLFVNGKAVLLDWKTNTYRFVATETVYNVTGSFEPSLNIVAKDAKRWDTSNQAHGVLNAYYPNHEDAWLMDIKGEYRSVSVNVKNYISGEDGKGAEGFAVNMGFKLSNGKEYVFRIIREKGKYYCQRFGINGNDWAKKELDAAAIAAICGDGVEFKLARTGDNALTVSVAGVVYDTYIMDGVTADTRVSAAVVGHYGNKDEKIALPFLLKTPTDAPDVQLNIAQMENGAVTPALEQYQVGDTVTLNITPAEGYSQKLYINGQPLLLGFGATSFSFEATEEVYEITGSFEPSLNVSAGGRWDASNQAHGVLNAYYPSNNDAWRIDINGEYRSVAIMAKNYLAQEDTMEGVAPEAFSAVISLKIGNTRYGFRLINKSVNGAPQYQYSRFGGEGATGWGGKCVLEEKVPGATAKLNGEGIEFKVTRINANTLQITLDGVVLDTYTISGLTDADQVSAATIYHYGNRGAQVEIPFVLGTSMVESDVQLEIAETTGGSVFAEQEGDTIVLTVTPDQGCELKSLVVMKDGKPVDIGTIQSTGGRYVFAAEAGSYTVAAEFAQPIFSVIKGEWDLTNQQNGSITITNQKEGTTVITNASDYKEFTVTVKDHTPSKNPDGSLKKGNFAAQVYFIFDNGKQYQVRIHNTDADGNYKIQNMGEGSSITGWKWQADLTAAQKEKLLGDGVEFTVKLSGANAELWVDGSLMKTVALGAEYEGKTAQIKLCMNGNTGVQNIEIPFRLKTPTSNPDVQLDIAETVGGIVSTEQDGDTITLIATPDAGYGLKALTVKKDGQPVDVGSLQSTGGRYSFVAEDGIYTVEAVFEELIFQVVNGNWDLRDQFNGSITITNQKEGTTVITNASDYKEFTVTVKDHTPSKNPDGSLKKGNFAAQVYFIFDNGKQYQVRIHNTDADGNYKLQNMGEGSSITGWKWQADLTAAQKEKLLGDGVEFTVKLSGANAELWVDGSLMKTVALGAEYEGKTAQIKLCMNGNTGVQNMQLPFVLKTPEDANKIQLNVAAMTNGTVTPDRESYNLGDTVTLTVIPNANFSQKLYINGQPLLLDWKSNTCSFVATEQVYEITGSFVPSISLSTTASNDAKWDTANQAHNVIGAYYPTGNDAWRLDINGEYESLAVVAKNFLPQADTMEGGSLGGYSIVVGMKIGNTRYAFRIINKNVNGAPQYQYSRFGGEGATGWGGKCVLDEKVPGATAKLNGEGIEFKVTRINANALQITLDGVVLDTYTISGLTDADQVTAVSIYHYGNRGEKIQIPFATTAKEN